MTRTFLVAVASALLVAGCTLTVDPSEYAPKTAGDCAAGEKPCGYKCVPVNDPATGCGGTSCDACPGAAANAVAACRADGQCGFACNPGWDDCDQQPATGCEAPVGTPANCGACGRVCSGICEIPAYVCQPSGALATGGEVKGLAEDSATGWVFALVKPLGIPGQLAYVPGLSAPTVQVLDTGLGYVSGLAFHGGAAWFGRSVGVSEVGYYASLSPLLPMQVKDTLVAPETPYAGPAVDLVSGASGTLWIPDVGAPLRFVASTASLGTPVWSGPDFTALAHEPIYERYFAAETGRGGTIWMTTSPASGGFSEVLDGAGRVAAMAAVHLGGNYVLYWVDVDRGDVWRYEAISVKKERIFAGSGPTTMDIAVDNVGDAYWTDRVAGTVMAWKSYGGFPPAVHVIGRSPSPGRIMVNSAFVYWADDSEQLIRAVTK